MNKKSAKIVIDKIQERTYTETLHKVTYNARIDVWCSDIDLVFDNIFPMVIQSTTIFLYNI